MIPLVVHARPCAAQRSHGFARPFCRRQETFRRRQVSHASSVARGCGASQRHGTPRRSQREQARSSCCSDTLEVGLPAGSPRRPSHAALAILHPSQVPLDRPLKPQPNDRKLFSVASTPVTAGDATPPAAGDVSTPTAGGRATPRAFAFGHTHSRFSLAHRMQQSDPPSQRHFSLALRQAAHARFLGALGSHAMPNRLHRAQHESSSTGTAGSVREQLHFDF